ncbi:hypothetical protein [Ancylobacter mangrovi]|uniref:hypothetical protein n=1 Tax=Ancylobacter mangrovi TaxID=2972472 RepID=UPI002162D0D4|nr:hypothetical protein [Ancylobacter mangrovi]MCS0501079.1 hypothetical protein [Ancylobacter mangrovi]
MPICGGICGRDLAGEPGAGERCADRQVSDHAPLWIEIATDFAADYLQAIAVPPG